MGTKLQRVVIKAKNSAFYGRKGEVVEERTDGVVVLIDQEESPNTFFFLHEEVKPLVRKRAAAGNTVRAMGFSKTGEDVDGLIGEVETIDQDVAFVRAPEKNFHVKLSQLRVIGV